jgi:hypothetical protein
MRLRTSYYIERPGPDVPAFRRVVAEFDDLARGRDTAKAYAASEYFGVVWFVIEAEDDDKVYEVWGRTMKGWEIHEG